MDRETSKRLFRDSYMLEVCVAVARAEDRVNLRDLAAVGDVTPSLYAKPVRRLQELGLLLDDPREGDDYRMRWCSRVESSLWQTALELSQ